MWTFLEFLKDFWTKKSTRKSQIWTKNSEQIRKNATHIFDQDLTQNNIRKVSRKWSKIYRNSLGIFLREILNEQGCNEWNHVWEQQKYEGIIESAEKKAQAQGFGVDSDHPNTPEALDWSVPFKTLNPRARITQRTTRQINHTITNNPGRTHHKETDQMARNDERLV
jgi:hypothetical protein